MNHLDAYLKIETAILRERQRAVSASCYTPDEESYTRCVVCFPVSETSLKNRIYEIRGNKAYCLDDAFNDVITLWQD